MRSMNCTVPRSCSRTSPTTNPALVTEPLIELMLVFTHAFGASAAPRVTMLMMPKNALAPYTDDTGPRITSMRAISSIEMKLSKPRPANDAHASLIVAPSTSTRMRVL